MIAGTLEIQLLANMARLQKDMDDAKRTVGDAMKGIESAVNMAKMAFVAFAGVASINAFKGMIQGSIEASAGLHDMAMQTGASVAALAAFRSVAATTNTSIEGIAGSMNKMAKGMAVANEDSKGIGQAVQALGLNFNELRSMKPEDQMLAVAKAMDGFQDGAGKSAVAMALYGKEGAKMIPFMKDLADSSEDVSKKLTAQQVAAKAAQAAMADDYTDNLTKIKKASDAWKKDIGMAMLPALYELSQAFIDVNKGAGGIKAGVSSLANDGSITDWARAAISGATYVLDAFAGVVRVITSVGQTIGGIAAIIADSFGTAGVVIGKVLRGDFAGALAENEAAGKRQKAIWGDLKDTLDKSWSDQTFGQQLRARMTELQGVAVVAKAAKADLKFEAPAEKESGKSSAEKISDYQKLTRVIAEKQAQDSLQLTTGHALYESEKIRAKILADLNTGAIALNRTEKELLEIDLLDLAMTEQQIAATKAYGEAQKARQAAASALVKSAQDEADKNDALAKTFGMTQSAIAALEIARLEEQLAQKTSINQCTEETAKLEALIAAKKRSAAALGSVEAQQATADAAKKAFEEWKKTAEKISDSITDALMRGFESGKGFAANLRDTLTNMFKTMILRPTISAIVNPVAQGVTGMMGLSGAANAAGTAGTASGIGTLGSVAAGVSAFGGTLATGFMNTLVGSGMSGGLTAAGAMIANGAWASGLGMAAGALGPLGLGIAALSMIGNKDKSSSNTGDSSATYGSSGALLALQTTNGLSKTTTDMTEALQASYMAAAKSLGIALAQTNYNVNTNNGREGENPNTIIDSTVNGSRYTSGEVGSSDSAAMQLAASRAVFNALQSSDLPQYLSKVFDGLSAGALSQDQITNTLAYAASLKQVRDALLETREPLQILKDNVAQGTAALSTSAETFKTDFVAALDSGITPDKLAQWQGLQGAMDQLAQASGKATEAVKDIGRSIADIASERTRLQDQLDELTMTSAQMLDKQRSAIDDSNKSLFDQVQAQIALKDATTEAADAATKAADAAKAAAETYKQAAADRLSAVTGTASDAYAGLERAVAAQRAQEQAAYEAEKAIATTAFTSQNELYQKQIDSTKASLDAVGNSVGKLKSLSGSLKSTMDAMRITGSDSAYRAAAQAQIKAAVATARSGGGLPLDGQLQSALSTVSKPSEDLYATFVDYARDFYSTANDISALTNLTDAQLSADEISQALLKDQVDVLEAQKKLLKDGFKEQVSGLDAILANAKQQLDAANGLDTRVMSVADALRELNASIGQLAGTRASQGLATTPGVAASRATAIKDYITSAMGGGLTGTALANTIAAKAKEVGTTEGEIARAIGWDQSKVREFFAGAGIPQFEVGTNYVPRDMMAMLHEGEEVTPKAWNPAAGGRAGNNAEMAAALRAMADRLDKIEVNTRATAGHTAGTDRKLARVIPNNAVLTQVAV